MAIPQVQRHRLLIGSWGYEPNCRHYTWCNDGRVVFFAEGVRDPRTLGMHRPGRGASAGPV